MFICLSAHIYVYIVIAFVVVVIVIVVIRIVQIASVDVYHFLLQEIQFNLIQCEPIRLDALSCQVCTYVSIYVCIYCMYVSCNEKIDWYAKNSRPYPLSHLDASKKNFFYAKNIL